MLKMILKIKINSTVYLSEKITLEFKIYIDNNIPKNGEFFRVINIERNLMLVSI